MKKILLIGLAVFSSLCISAQEKHSYKDWVKEAPKFDDAFFSTPEAARIAENVLLYQQTTGGWPKNIRMQNEMTPEEYDKAMKLKEDTKESTIDNGSTTTEIRYLARMYNATGDEQYKEAVIKGIEYLFKSQYANGGWPQFWPRNKGYYTHITYNDNAMYLVMRLMQDIYDKKAPYTFLPESIVAQARIAFDKGVECILATQVKQNDKLTVWCAQHDEVTLAPAKARAYELPSLSGQESDELVLLLMSIPNPSPEVITAVEGAVDWFKTSQITGLKKEYFTNENGKRDYRMVACDDCEPLWARFYDLDTNQPFFSDRDGVKKYNLSEIGHERRNGYSWYNGQGTKVLKRYDKWKRDLSKKK